MNYARKKQFALNAASGWISQAVNISLGFFLLPYAIWKLGEKCYGIYQLAGSVIVFLNFLQLGMGPTIVRFCSQAIAINNKEQIKRISSNAQLILCIMGLLGMSLVLILIPWFIGFYTIPEAVVKDTIGLLVCMALSLLLSMLAIVPDGLLQGANRYELANGVAVCRNVLKAGLVFAAFELFTPSIYLFGSVVLIAQLSQLLMLFVLALKKVGQSILFSFQLIDAQTIKKLFKFSLIITINYFAFIALFQGPVLVVGKILSKEIVALFAPALLVGRSIQAFIGQSLNPLVTVAAQKNSKGESIKIGEWIIKISQVVSMAGFGFLLLFCLCGERLTGLWLGTEKCWLWKIIAAILFGTVLMPVQSVIQRMALGAGDIIPSVVSQVLLTVFVISGTILGTVYFGWQLFGVAMFMSLCIFVRSIYMAIAYSIEFSFEFRNYLLNVFAKPILICSLCFLIAMFLMKMLKPENILVSLGETFLIAIIYGFLSWEFLIPDIFKLFIRKSFIKKTELLNQI